MHQNDDWSVHYLPLLDLPRLSHGRAARMTRVLMAETVGGSVYARTLTALCETYRGASSRAPLASFLSCTASTRAARSCEPAGTASVSVLSDGSKLFLDADGKIIGGQAAPSEEADNSAGLDEEAPR